MPTPQLSTSGNRGSYPTFGHNSGNVCHRGQYEHASALPTCYMDLIQWFGALLDDDPPIDHASVCQ